MIEDNNFHAAGDSNIAYRSYIVNNSWTLRLKPRLYHMGGNKTCKCSISNACSRQQGFYCRSASCQSAAPSPNQTIPGLNIGCFPLNSVLLSTLECFYNASCIQMLLDWRLFLVADVYYPLDLNVKPLDLNTSRQYLPTTPLEEIISGLLIEDWAVKTNDTAYYDQCKPQICTYNYVAGFEAIYVATTIIGILGGLSLVLRLTVPVLLRIVMQQMERQRRVLGEQMSAIASKLNNDD